MKQFTNLGLKDRRRLEILLNKGFKPNQIAKQIGFHRSTIMREIERNSRPNGVYDADFAEKEQEEDKNKRKAVKEN